MDKEGMQMMIGCGVILVLFVAMLLHRPTNQIIGIVESTNPTFETIQGEASLRACDFSVSIPDEVHLKFHSDRALATWGNNSNTGDTFRCAWLVIGEKVKIFPKQTEDKSISYYWRERLAEIVK